MQQNSRFKFFQLAKRFLRTKEPNPSFSSDRKSVKLINKLKIAKFITSVTKNVFFKIYIMQLLTTIDLCSLGVGSCVGTGVYLVSGLVVHDYAGPAAILSFMLAALASLLSGVCYAEFGVRIPHCTGTAYQYSYACAGELIAFLIGWNLLLEYMIGSAAGACAISAAIDSMFNGALKEFGENSLLLFKGSREETENNVALEKHHHLTKNQLKQINQQLLSKQNEWKGNNALSHLRNFFESGNYRPDFMAALICCVMTALLATGVRKSVKFNNCLNVFNLILFVFVVITALPLINFAPIT